MAIVSTGVAGENSTLVGNYLPNFDQSAAAGTLQPRLVGDAWPEIRKPKPPGSAHGRHSLTPVV
jgi:hypothetical protein